MITGGCLCRSIRYEIDELPSRVTHCHCKHCRGSAGAAFITWAEFDPTKFRYIQGKPEAYESRPKVTREFCPKCGTQLTYNHADEPGMVDVTVCSLDDPAIAKPEDHIWCDRKIPWVKLDDGLPIYKLGKWDE